MTRGIEKIRQAKLYGGRNAGKAPTPAPTPPPEAPMLGDYVITFETEHRIETWWRVGRIETRTGFPGKHPDELVPLLDAALTKGFAIRSFDLASLRYMRRTKQGGVACWELKQ